MKLYTFGYEGLDLNTFIDRLKEAGVRQVVDVREHPLSRKKGFSKNALSAVLLAHGIEYLSMTALGCPRAIRQRFKLGGDWRDIQSRSEEHTSELQSHSDLVCRLLLEKKNGVVAVGRRGMGHAVHG